MTFSFHSEFENFFCTKLVIKMSHFYTLQEFQNFWPKLWQRISNSDNSLKIQDRIKQSINDVDPVLIAIYYVDGEPFHKRGSVLQQ